MVSKLEAYPYADQIDDIMIEFNFEKVKLVMDFLDWKWTTGKRHPETTMAVPTLAELKEAALDKLQRVAAKASEQDVKGDIQFYSIGSGGFVATARSHRLQLDFMVENKRVYIETDDMPEYYQK